jgi:hypothetical protein
LSKTVNSLHTVTPCDLLEQPVGRVVLFDRELPKAIKAVEYGRKEAIEGVDRETVAAINTE